MNRIGVKSSPCMLTTNEIQHRSGAGYHYGRDSLNSELDIEVDHEEQIVIL